MAAGIITTPGTQYGACKEGCQHIDCAADRKMAAMICRLCGRAIGYETGFYRDPQNPNNLKGSDQPLVHAFCFMRDDA